MLLPTRIEWDRVNSLRNEVLSNLVGELREELLLKQELVVFELIEVDYVSVVDSIDQVVLDARRLYIVAILLEYFHLLVVCTV